MQEIQQTYPAGPWRVASCLSRMPRHRTFRDLDACVANKTANVNKFIDCDADGVHADSQLLLADMKTRMCAGIAAENIHTYDALDFAPGIGQCVRHPRAHVPASRTYRVFHRVLVAVRRCMRRLHYIDVYIVFKRSAASVCSTAPRGCV